MNLNICFRLFCEYNIHEPINDKDSMRKYLVEIANEVELIRKQDFNEATY